MGKKGIYHSDNICEELHKILWEGKRFSFQADLNGLPKNGIYILFQKDEYGHGGERIVRIGTHTGQNQLPSRIKQHFIDENKDRSIFRKRVGRCFLNGNPFLSIWDIDLTNANNRRKYGNCYNIRENAKWEKEVSKYIQENFSFCLLDVEEKADRMKFEALLIGTVSNCSACRPSDNWLGLKSPTTNPRQKGEIVIDTGLWLSEKAYSKPLTREDLIFVSGALVR